MMKKITSFFFLFLFIPVGNALAQSELPEFSGPIVPEVCRGGGPFACGSCELLQLGQNIINFFIFFAVVTAVLMFVYAGFKYITAVGNPGQISSAHKIFWNVFIGLVIILAAWLIIDLLMKSFYVEGDLGPWNDILCVGAGGVAVKPPPTGTPPPVVVPPPPSTSKNICYEITGKEFLIETPIGSNIWEECLSTEPNCELKRIAITGITYTDDSECSLSCSTGVAICSNPTSLTTGDDTIIIDPVIKSNDILSHGEAKSQLQAAGVTIFSSGNCSDTTKKNCTSLDGIRQATIDEVIALKQACGCSVTVTGGTETGHETGTFSHATGYKIDIDDSAGVTQYIEDNCSQIGDVSGDPLYDCGTTAQYVHEDNHFDIFVP